MTASDGEIRHGQGGLVEVDWRDGLCTITLNRPDKANALNGDMLAGISAALAEAGRDAKVVVITGRGKVFSAGADLDEIKSGGLAQSPVWEEVSGRLAALPCLTIAALNGTLAGGAFGMALACDIRVAVAGASFFYPVLRLGQLPQPSDPLRMRALIGPSRTAMILAGGCRIGAETALTWGLIDEIAGPDGLDAAVERLAEAALSADPAHLARIITMVRGQPGR